MKHPFSIGLLVVALLIVGGTAGCKQKPKGVTALPAVSRTTTAQKPDVAPLRGGPGTTTDPGTPVVDPGRTTTTEAPVTTTTETPSGFPLPEGIIDDTGYLRDENIFKPYTVYFDFDKSTVKAGERAKVETVANHLKANATQKVKVEGHCDERGTEGYNLSLGDRRALAIREYLIRLGIAADRVYNISFGESKPVAEGHDESAWSQNRRGEFILLSPKE